MAGRGECLEPATAVLRKSPPTARGPRVRGGHTTATAVAGLSSPSRSGRTERFAGQTMGTIVRIAAIGVGRLGLLHAQNLARRVPGAELAMVVDVDEAAARRAGDLCGVPYTTDYRA